MLAHLKIHGWFWFGFGVFPSPDFVFPFVFCISISIGATNLDRQPAQRISLHRRITNSNPSIRPPVACLVEVIIIFTIIPIIQLHLDI